MSAEKAALLLAECCGSSRWVEMMISSRPFASREAVFSAADEMWSSLVSPDFLEAFAHHPRIGEQGGGSSAKEQSGMDRADAGVRAALAEVNREYERRFGYIYIVSASGKSAQEMLAIAQERLHNDATVELKVAADEQRKITQLRLHLLLSAP
jgi:2-oxo-4-hydroxy-4-carboxy-5-ureidoimidazoline decarboxylase